MYRPMHLMISRRCGNCKTNHSGGEVRLDGRNGAFQSGSDYRYSRVWRLQRGDLCERLDIKSSKDKDKLKQAKDEVYLMGFNKGVMTVGEYKGMFVKDALLFASNSSTGEMLRPTSSLRIW